MAQNSLSQLLNWGSPSLLHGLPIESSVIVGHGPKYYHTLGDWWLSRALSISLSISITLFLCLCHFHINKQTLNTEQRPCPSPLGCMYPGRHQMSERLLWNKKEGLSAERRNRTRVWFVVGGELLLRRGMIFFCYIYWAFTFFGHQAACWSRNSKPSINWGRENFEKSSDKVTLAGKEWTSLWLFYGKWRM